MRILKPVINQIELEKEAKIKEMTDYISRVYNQMLQSVRRQEAKGMGN